MINGTVHYRAHEHTDEVFINVVLLTQLTIYLSPGIPYHRNMFGVRHTNEFFTEVLHLRDAVLRCCPQMTSLTG